MNAISWMLFGGLVLAIVCAVVVCCVSKRGGCSGCCSRCPYGGDCHKQDAPKNGK